MLVFFLLIATTFIIPAQFELPEVNLEHCKDFNTFDDCMKEAAEKSRGGTFELKKVLIWSGIGTWGGNNIEGGGGSDELLIRVQHLIHTIPVKAEEIISSQPTNGKKRKAVEYNVASVFSFWNNPKKLGVIGVGLLDVSNELHLDFAPADEDIIWDQENNDEDQKFGACTESSDYSVQMCSWAKISLAKSADNDNDKPHRVVKICTSVYRVLAKGPKRQRVLPMLGCFTLDDICTMEDPSCFPPVGAAATFNAKNAEMQGAEKTEL